MIKKEDLRHGNYVMDRGGKILRIDYFERDKICMEVILNFGQIGHPLTEYFDYLKPIPLSIGFLDKNAVKNGEGTYSIFLTPFDKDEGNRQKIDFYQETDGKVELCRSGVCFKRVHCNSVHELQNLFYILKDSDMEITF